MFERTGRELWATSGRRRFVLSDDAAAIASWAEREIQRAPAVLWPQALRALVASTSAAERTTLHKFVPAHVRNLAHVGQSDDTALETRLLRALGAGRRLSLGMMSHALRGQAAWELPAARALVARAAALAAPEWITSSEQPQAARPMTSLVLRNDRGQALRVAVRLRTSEAGHIAYETGPEPVAQAWGAGAVSFELWEAPWPKR